MVEIYTPSAPIQWDWVSLSGPDARDFLHRLTTVNLNTLALGQGSPGFFLNPQGKVRVYFTLWNLEPDHFAFELEGGHDGKWKAELLSVIDQYTFAEKMTLYAFPPIERTSLWIFGDASALALPAPEAWRTIEKDGLRFCHHGTADFGRPWITAWGSPKTLDDWRKKSLSSVKNLDLPTLERWRVEALRPRADLELQDSPLPLEVGLRHAISENKGCYPGQEVIEKIISLGAPPRRLAQLRGDGPAPKPGEDLFDAATNVGRITSIIDSQTGFTALALVRKTHAQPGAQLRFGADRSGSATVAQIARDD